MFMLLHASAVLHSVPFDFAMNSLCLFSFAVVTASPRSATLTATTPLFSLLVLLFFSLWQNEMGYSAAAAFQHHPHADIPLHKQCLIAV